MSNKPISFKLIFNRKNELDESGHALIQIRAYKDNAAVFISTGIHIKPEHWDEGKERIVRRSDNHTLNNRINKTIEQLKEIEHKISFSNQAFGVKELISILIVGGVSLLCLI